jgi:phosphoglycerol transferase MdoB-like AlkP superfamily enzyme
VTQEGAAGGGPRPGETEGDRLDRNLGELLQELRVALPGVQVLFAFLLAVPFQQNFDQTSHFQRSVYLATLMLTAISSALLIAPTAYHRMTFRYQRKDPLVVLGNRLALAGLTSLGLAMTGAILLVTDFIFSPATAVLACLFAVAMFSVLWYLVPAMARREALKVRRVRTDRSGPSR